MVKDETQSNQLNLTVVALVALVAIVGLVALVINVAGQKVTVPGFGSVAQAQAQPTPASTENTAGNAWEGCHNGPCGDGGNDCLICKRTAK